MALEGYSSAVSVLPGDQIDFHLNADAPTDVTVRILRVSRAGPVVAIGSGHVVPQTARANASAAGAGWAPAYTLDVPANCYKSALEDPLTGVDNSRVTVNWYDAPVARPENAMTGVSFRNGAGRWTGGVDGACWRLRPWTAGSSRRMAPAGSGHTPPVA